jgi:hypothetical protein
MQKRDCAVLSNTRGIGLDATSWARNLQCIETLSLPHLPPVELVAQIHRSGEENKPSGTHCGPFYLI